MCDANVKSAIIVTYIYLLLSVARNGRLNSQTVVSHGLTASNSFAGGLCNKHVEHPRLIYVCRRISLMPEYGALANAICHVSEFIPQQKHVVPISAESAAAAVSLSREFLQVSNFGGNSLIALCSRPVFKYYN